MVGEQTLNISSLTRINGGKIFHLPLLDFECKIGSENLQMILAFIKWKLGQGVVLESGQSYHVYGLQLLDEESLVNFLGYALLLKDYIDTRYIAHHLINMELCLRITANTTSKTQIPRVVAWV